MPAAACASCKGQIFSPVKNVLGFLHKIKTDWQDKWNIVEVYYLTIKFILQIKSMVKQI